MIKLYLDFDGVILNTIDTTYNIFAERNITDVTEMQEFYRYLDWDDLLNNKCSEINNSIKYIRKIIDSGLYDVSVLTHCYTNREAVAKTNYLHSKNIYVDVVAVPVGSEKCDAVNAKGAVLIDDYSRNLELWKKEEGISIKFSDNGRSSEFITIRSLNELLSRYNEIKEATDKYKKVSR